MRFEDVKHKLAGTEIKILNWKTLMQLRLDYASILSTERLLTKFIKDYGPTCNIFIDEFFPMLDFTELKDFLVNNPCMSEDQDFYFKNVGTTKIYFLMLHLYILNVTWIYNFLMNCRVQPL
jgi:hypothetical protein